MVLDMDKLRAKAEKLNSENSSNDDFLAKFLKLETGTTYVRFLPWKDESKEFYAETIIHRVPRSRHDVGSKGAQVKNIHCLKQYGKKCPVCEYYYFLWKTGIKHDETIARAIKGRERYYLNAINRDENKVKILSVGKKLFGRVVNFILDPDYGDIIDPQTGHDFKIIKKLVQTGDQVFPNYDDSSPRPKPSTLSDSQQEIDAFMAELHDIHDLVKEEEYDVVKTYMEEFKNGPKVETESTTQEPTPDSEEKTEEPKGDLSDQEYLDRLNA